MSRRFTTLASWLSCLAALLLLVGIARGNLFVQSAFFGSDLLAYVLAACLLCVGGISLLTRFDRGRTAAWLRLDWYAPSVRRKAPDQPVAHSLPGRWLRRLIPNAWQSNWQTKQRGALRKSLRRLGASWLASPVRRIVQATCLVLFLTLFLYVCWPYSARPRSDGKASDGWTYVRLDQDAGEFLFEPTPGSDATREAALRDWLRTDAVVYLVDTRNPDFSSVHGRLGAFAVVGFASGTLRLRANEPLTGTLLAALANRGSSTAKQFELVELDPAAWPAHYAENLQRKELLPAETFLVIDPLVALSTAVASRSWVWSLVCAAAILLVCLIIPRGFCGYVCPLGTTIDLFDWVFSRRILRWRVAGDGWWVHIKYYLLAGILIAALGGVLVSGYFSAIPVLTRGLLFIVDPVQSGVARGWHLVPSFNSGHVVSLILFLGVLSLGFLKPRFWCKYVCPSGAVFSLGNLLRISERKVESSCIHCNKCVEICPFDAIKPDFTTRTSDCTLCQSCGGVCPTHAIKFVERWNVVELKVAEDPPTGETSLGRRGFLSLAAGSTAAVVGGAGLLGLTKASGARLHDPNTPRPVRPPGSVPEAEFLQMCIRCGECFKACPNNVLQPEAFQQGLEGLWTPLVNADWAGCESSCNACGQVCPTGAIRALPLEEKRVARMGLAVVNETTCLPFAQTEACDLCVQECHAAGYHAIEFTQVGTELDESGQPIDGTGYLAPAVLKDACVGCGLCQTRCYAINVKERGLLNASAIVIEAGEGKEDRLMRGSYLELRQREQQATQAAEPSSGSGYLAPTRAEEPPVTEDAGGEDESPF